MWLDDTRDPRVYLPRKFPGVEWTDELFDEWVWVKPATKPCQRLGVT